MGTGEAAALVAGRPGDAHAHLHRLFDPADPAHHPFVAHIAVIGLAEAAAGRGRRTEALELLAPLEDDATRPHPARLHRAGGPVTS